MASRKMLWKVDTPRLLKEVLNNPGTGILSVPLNILGHILYELGERASELNDPKLNALMCRLAIYSQADPDSTDYDAELTRKIIEEAYDDVEVKEVKHG